MDDKSLFVLVPPADYTKHMPNFGDYALHSGMRVLLKECYQGPLLYDEWNSFPRLTWKWVSRFGSPVEGMKAWGRKYQQWLQQQDSFDERACSILSGAKCSRLPVWTYLERQARKRTGQSWQGVLIPRVFPAVAGRRFAVKLASASAVVMNGGGLLSDHLKRYLPGRIFALDTAVNSGLRTAVVNYSFAITKPELLDCIAPVFRSISLHSVRESISRDRLLALGVHAKKILVTPDLAFAEPAPDRVKKRNDKLTIALQVRGDMQQDFAAWGSLIKHLSERFEGRIVFLPGCRLNDPPVFHELKKYVAMDPFYIPSSHVELKKLIGDADLLISDRYHGLIFATQMGTPFLPIVSTTLKTEGFIQDLRYPYKVCEKPCQDNIPEIIKDASRLLKNSEEISSWLQRRAAELRSLLYEHYRLIFSKLMNVS